MKRVLVVDDDPTYLTLEEKVLEREGYEVVTAEDGARAMDLEGRQQINAGRISLGRTGLSDQAVYQFPAGQDG
jgi:CheY-like chemotaxis protein